MTSGTSHHENSASEAGPTRNRNVLIVTSDFGGGTGTHLRSLLEHRDLKTCPTTLLCQGNHELSPPTHVPMVTDAARGPLHRFPVAQARRLRQLHYVVLQQAPAIVHTYFTWSIILGRILKQMGVIRHLVENREDQGFSLSEWDLRLLRLTANVPDRIICVSDAVRRVVLESEGVRPSRATVIRNGIHIPEDLPSDWEHARLRRELGFSPGDLIVGMVANLNRPVKGVGHFLDAIPRIRARVSNARFLIVGGGELEPSLRKKARELKIDDAVVFAGRRTNVTPFYGIMDVSVLTSLSEGLSIVALESMSFGLPLVLTDVGGNPEVVEDGTNGFLVPPRDADAFSNAVVRLLSNAHLRRQLGHAGSQRVRGEFALKKVEERYQGIYDEVLRHSALHDDPPPASWPQKTGAGVTTARREQW